MKRLSLLLCFVGAMMSCASNPPVQAAPVQEAVQLADKTVVLYQFRFNPNTLQIPAGTTVIFKNKDGVRHNVTATSLGIDQMIEPGTQWSYTFSSTGEYAVENRLADSPMKASIVVE